MSRLLIGYAMIGYGSVRVYETPRAVGEGDPTPSGEGDPPMDHWAVLLPFCKTVDEIVALLTLARSELADWKRRPDPPPEGETLADLKERVLGYAGWEPKDVALACRCTPTLVRRARTEAERNPETGREEGSLEHARALLSQGLSLRQVAVLTGIPKSTLHRQTGVASGRRGD